MYLNCNGPCVLCRRHVNNVEGAGFLLLPHKQHPTDARSISWVLLVWQKQKAGSFNIVDMSPAQLTRAIAVDVIAGLFKAFVNEQVK